MYENTPDPVLFKRHALPQMAGLLCNTVYIIADGLFIGTFLGTGGLAAAGAAVPVTEFMIALSVALSSGSGILIAGSLARGEKDRAALLFTTCLIMTGLAALVLMAVSIFLPGFLADLLGATPAIRQDTITYLRIVLLLCPFLLFSYLLAAMVRCDGRDRLAMTALLAGSFITIGLDALFLAVCRLGIAGAALAFALGPLASDLILLPHFLRSEGALSLRTALPKGRDVLQIARLSVPSFVLEYAIGMLTLLYNRAINQNGFGEAGLSAYLVIGYLALLNLTLFLGMAQGLQPVFSAFSARGRKDRAAGLYRYARRRFLLVGILGAAAGFLVSVPFSSLFLPGEDDLISFTAARCAVYGLGYPFAGCSILLVTCLSCEGRTGKSLLLCVLRSTLFPLLFLLLLPVFFGAQSIWIAWPLSEAALFALSGLSFFQLQRK